MVQLAAMTTDKKGGPKYTTGPLYTIIRTVLAKGNQRINITGYGQVKTSGQAWIVVLTYSVGGALVYPCIVVLTYSVAAVPNVSTSGAFLHSMLTLY